MTSRISLTIGAGSMTYSASADIPVRAITHCQNEDGTTTIKIDFALAPQEGNTPLTRADVQDIVDRNYERVRSLVQRSHVSSARSVNTVTQRYTNKAVKAIYKRESSVTESEPSDLELKIPASPKTGKRKQPPSEDTQSRGQRPKLEAGN